MDGIHDLGGKQGYGPVPVKAGDAPFDHDWERRMWGLARGGLVPSITIDWFRHGLEVMVPGDYLTYAYFQKWATNYLMIFADDGIATLDEIAAGHVTHPLPPAAPKTVSQVIEQVRAGCTDFSTPADAAPRFFVGGTVQTVRQGTAPHTRLPAYARNRSGTIIAHHGCHLLPDEGARGRHVGAHLYTVSFTARELWGADAHPADTVTLELWESYLVPA
jgi:nitrile hydratase subunit beta